MKLLTAFAVLFTAAMANAQMFDETSAAELKKIDWLLGDWEGTMKFYFMGPDNPSEDKGTIKATKALGGNYIQGLHKSTMPIGEMEGINLITFDPGEKKFKAYWFDSVGAGALEMTGDLTGNTLVMTSKPMAMMPGQPETVYRATWTRKSDTEVEFLLETGPASGGQWSKAIEGSFTKAR